MFRSGPVRGKYNRVGPGPGPLNLLFFGPVRVGAKDNGAIRGRGAKNLALQDSSSNVRVKAKAGVQGAEPLGGGHQGVKPPEANAF